MTNIFCPLFIWNSIMNDTQSVSFIFFEYFVNDIFLRTGLLSISFIQPSLRHALVTLHFTLALGSLCFIHFDSNKPPKERHVILLA